LEFRQNHSKSKMPDESMNLDESTTKSTVIRFSWSRSDIFLIDIARRKNSCTVFREYTRVCVCVCVLDYCEYIGEHQRMAVNYTEAEHFEFYNTPSATPGDSEYSTVFFLLLNYF